MSYETSGRLSSYLWRTSSSSQKWRREREFGGAPPRSWGLPLHAAGPYSYEQKNFPDIYVSSYTSSLSALIWVRADVPFHCIASVPRSPISPNINVIHPPLQPPSVKNSANIHGFRALIPGVWYPSILSSIAVLLLASAALGIPLDQTVEHARSVGVESYYPDSVYEVRIDHKHSKFHLMLLSEARRGSSCPPDLEPLTMAFFETRDAGNIYYLQGYTRDTAKYAYV